MGALACCNWIVAMCTADYCSRFMSKYYALIVIDSFTEWSSVFHQFFIIVIRAFRKGACDWYRFPFHEWHCVIVVGHWMQAFAHCPEAPCVQRQDGRFCENFSKYHPIYRREYTCGTRERHKKFSISIPWGRAQHNKSLGWNSLNPDVYVPILSE